MENIYFLFQYCLGFSRNNKNSDNADSVGLVAYFDRSHSIDCLRVAMRFRRRRRRRPWRAREDSDDEAEEGIERVGKGEWSRRLLSHNRFAPWGDCKTSSAARPLILIRSLIIKSCRNRIQETRRWCRNQRPFAFGAAGPPSTGRASTGRAKVAAGGVGAFPSVSTSSLSQRPFSSILAKLWN